MNLRSAKIGFLGAGTMGKAVLGGLLSKELVERQNIYLSDINTDRLNKLKKFFGVNIAKDNTELVQYSDIVVLAVKPFVAREVLNEIGDIFTSGQLLVSIVAGLGTNTIESFLKEVPIVRVMPNTPCQVYEGASALCGGRFADKRHVDMVLEIFESIGQALVVPEALMDVVTGLSGSGPAYAYLIIEALADGAVKAGLPKDIALILAAQTLKGAGEMVLKTGSHPAYLKSLVTTPGGTTAAGLYCLEKNAVRSAFIDAVEAACAKSCEMGKGQ